MKTEYRVRKIEMFEVVRTTTGDDSVSICGIGIAYDEETANRMIEAINAGNSHHPTP
jgi:hypothetical protein